MKRGRIGDRDTMRTLLEWEENGDGTADVSRDGGRTWQREKWPVEIWRDDGTKLVVTPDSVTTIR